MAAPAIAYGFVGLQHLFATRVNTAGIEITYRAIEESAAEHSRVINELMSQWVEPTEMAQEQFELPTGGTLQPLDEWGRPRPRKHTGNYQVAYPIRGGGDAWASNRIASALMTVQEVNRNMIAAQMADANWLRENTMAAVLDNTTWTFNDKTQGAWKGLGDITIQPLANGDTVQYTRKNGSTAIDDHYLAQAAAIADGANPFPTIYDELMEHPSNMGGDVIVYIPTNLKTTVKALTNFIPAPDANVVYGNASDRLARVVARGFGDDVIGYVDECFIVEWGHLPDNYMIGHATGGGSFLKMREYPAAELKGLFVEPLQAHQGISGTSLLRYAGIAAANRIGAVVYQIGNATYQIPTGFTQPITPF